MIFAEGVCLSPGQCHVSCAFYRHLAIDRGVPCGENFPFSAPATLSELGRATRDQGSHMPER